MPCRRNRQELGNSLDNPEDDGLQQRHRAFSRGLGPSSICKTIPGLGTAVGKPVAGTNMNANLTSICPAALNRCPEVVERLGSLAKQLVPLSARAHGNLVAWPARRANRGCGRPSSGLEAVNPLAEKASQCPLGSALRNPMLWSLARCDLLPTARCDVVASSLGTKNCRTDSSQHIVPRLWSWVASAWSIESDSHSRLNRPNSIWATHLRLCQQKFP